MEKYIVKEQFHLASIRNVVRKSSIIKIENDIVTIINPESGFSCEYPRATLTELNALKQMPKFMEQYTEELAKEIKPDVVVEVKQPKGLDLKVIDSDSDAHPVVEIDIKGNKKTENKAVTKDSIKELKVEIMETTQVTELDAKNINQKAKSVDASQVNEKTEVLTTVVENKEISTPISVETKEAKEQKSIDAAVKKIETINLENSEVAKIDVGNQAVKKVKKKILPLD